MYKSLRIQPETHANVKLLSGMMGISMDLVIRSLTTIEINRRLKGLQDIEDKIDILLNKMKKDGL